MMAPLEKEMNNCRFWKNALLIVLVAALWCSTAHAQTVQEVVSTVENHYSELKDMSAKVVQKNFMKSIGKTQTFDGNFLIKKPGKLRIDYTNGQIILVDGKAVMFYSKKSRQMIKKAFTDFQQMNIPIAFLLGAAHIRDDFDVIQPDLKAPRTLGLLPKKSEAAMKKLTIQTDDAGRIVSLVIFDKYGNTTDIRFSEITEGIGLTDKQFVFTAPKGTEIIEQ